MSLHPLEHQATDGDRYLAAYASVHSILEQPAGSTVSTVPAVPVLSDPAIPAARLAHSTGGRHKQRRRLFRPAPALATG